MMLSPQSPKQQFDLRLSATATPLVVRQTLCHVEETLQKWGLSSGTRHNTQLVLGEVLNNIAEHAYAPELVGSFRLALNLDQDALSVLVSDEGKPLPNGSLPIGAEPDLQVPLEDLPEGGYGWFIVRTLTENLDYIRQGRENVLSFQVIG